MVEEARAQWGSSLEFILTVIGFAVGLGNVWRFPFLVFRYGGGPFLVIFFLMLFLVGIPMFFLELAIGQFSGLGPSHCFYRMAPIFQGLGYAALTINALIGFYYNCIIGYCLYYLVMSFRAKLLWSDCTPEWSNLPIPCVKRDFNETCEKFKERYPNSSLISSPSENYFYNEVLSISDGISNLGELQYPVVIALFAAWLIVFLALSKGVQSLGKVSYITATFPYLMLTVLVITGSLLTGAGKGVDFYLGIGNFDTSLFAKPEVWKAATVQVFYALSACAGGLIAMSSFNNFKNNIIRDMLLIPILDCLTGLYAGFAIFTVLGYMYVSKCATDFSEVAAAGPELAFIVYPEGLSLIEAVPPLWSVLFFLMMIALGFGSEFSIMETFMVMIMDVFKKFLDTKLKKTITRGCICLVFFLLGLSMTSRGGFYILSLIDEYVAGYPLLVVGFLQVIVVPWVYGTRRFFEDIQVMVGPLPHWFFIVCFISWNIICPVVLLVIIIMTIALPGSKLIIHGVSYPDWAHAIGWIIVAAPIAMIIGCAIAQVILYKFNWRALFSPDDEYYNNRNKFLLNENSSDVINMKEKRPSTNKISPLDKDYGSSGVTEIVDDVVGEEEFNAPKQYDFNNNVNKYDRYLSRIW